MAHFQRVLLFWLFSCVARGDHSVCSAIKLGDLSVVKGCLQTEPSLLNQPVLVQQRRSMLHLAAAYGHTDVCRLLLQSRAEVNQKDAYGETPLHRCARFGRVATGQLLTGEEGVNLNEPDNNLDSPLHTASSCGRGDFVKMLLHAGADPLMLNKEGQTALDTARSSSYSNKLTLQLLDKAQCVQQWLQYFTTAQLQNALYQAALKHVDVFEQMQKVAMQKMTPPLVQEEPIRTGSSSAFCPPLAAERSVTADDAAAADSNCGSDMQPQ